MIARLIVLAASAALFMSAPVRAQDYPAGPITVVVPWAPGSTGDVMYRILAEALEPRLGQRLLLDNRPGAGGNIGTAYVAHAEPDGYTLLLGPNNVFTLNQFLYVEPGYDPAADLVPITKTHDSPYVLYVNDHIPARTIEDLIAYANESGPLFFPSSGLGTPGHMAAIQFRNLTGANIEIIPYGSSSQSVNALLQDEVQAYIASAAVGISQVEAGGLHVVAVAGPNRISAYPDAPSAVEAGLPEFSMSNWWGLAAPQGTPPEIIDRLYEEIAAALATPEVQEQVRNLGALPAGDPPDEFAQEIAAETAFWEELVRSENLQPQ